jgi:serine/threonine protein kinase
MWAMGCVIFHMCAHDPPFYGENLISLGYNIVNKPPKKIPTSYSQELNQFILKLLDKQPTSRPSAKEIMTILS